VAVPILKQGPFLIATIQAALTDSDVLQLQDAVIGIQPEVAFAMVQLGMSFEDVLTALDLEEGLALLTRPWKEAGDGGG
jgi:rsbT antagonist protein RsbS